MLDSRGVLITGFAVVEYVATAGIMILEFKNKIN